MSGFSHAGSSQGLHAVAEFRSQAPQRSRRLQLVLVQAFDGVVDREDHQQDVGVAETGIERDIYTDEVDWLVPQSESHTDRINDARRPEQDSERERA